MISTCWSCAVVLVVMTAAAHSAAPEKDKKQTVGESLDARLKHIEQSMSHISRQLMLQQMFVEERIRSDGKSGIKQLRLTRQGTKTYHSTTYSGKRAAAMHDHSNLINTVGMGEFVAVLNGVEFRTRHNDYKLVKPASIAPGMNRTAYNQVEAITFPDVPKTVTEKDTIEEQIQEMREYFKAFSQQNETHRNYKDYFKPLLCFLEGGWTVSDGGAIEESFDSDRHHLDASSWLDLQEKVRYSSYTGRKDRFENFAYLPTTITKVVNGVPILAQWNYRIVCHPLKNYLSTKRLVLVDDLDVRMANKHDIKQYEMSRAARYKLAPKDQDFWKEDSYRYDFLDELMSEIPGKDGYGANMVDDGISGSRAKSYVEPEKDLNAAYYHRWFTGDRDAMGSRFQHRGFDDDSLFAASTTQEKIAPAEVEYCRKKKCVQAKQRFTYAIPLEIIYLTPLNSWNPHNITYKHNVDPKVSTNSGKKPGNALTHAWRRLYDITPLEFYASNGYSGDPADTSNGYMYVKDGKGVPQKVVASGARILLPPIPGIDRRVRLRFPIMPIHQEGSVYWKKIDALQDSLRAKEEL
ncbi:uncharacterized protein LOC141913152 [Tubulanus polymorphus]|uniref:uncharacterized protein LOC141913152 n=1 Tax=Tubulanus polymorphus TaxID=672921 RepID=UPI003DA2714E